MSARAPISIMVTSSTNPLRFVPRVTRFVRHGRLAARCSWHFRVCRRLDEQILFVPDEVVLAVDGELVILPHENRRYRTRFLAVAAEDAARLVDLVHLRVSRPRHYRS